jgi:hypothetical protein
MISERPCRRTSAFGRDDQRTAVSQGLHCRAEGLNSLGGVRPVDEHDPSRPEQGTKDRVVTKLLLGDTREIAAEKLEHQHELEPALMIEDEHCGAARPEVLLTLDTKIDPRSRCREISPYGAHDVDCFAFRAVQEAGDDAEPDRGGQAPVDQPGTNYVANGGRSAAGETADRPLSLLCNLRQLARGVQRTRAPHDVEKGKVLVAVGIEIAFLQIEVVIRSEASPGSGLALAVAGGTHHLAGEDPVFDT